MSYLIAAAGTGGHVFPGLAVGEALVDLGVDRSEVLFVGGDRLEARVFPEEGFPFLGLRLRGLHRSPTPRNLTLPFLVIGAKRRIAEAIAGRGVRSVLGMGGYVTVPAALAARVSKVPLYIAEQNAEAGLANRLASRMAETSFTSFPHTRGLPSGEWVGNPVREPFWRFDRPNLRPRALSHYGLTGDLPVLGVFGGSLGAGVINDAVAAMVGSWAGPPMQVVHITGPDRLEALSGRRSVETVEWRRVGFEEAMELFYAASDLVVARSGGAVAELTATATPAILVPGRFGSAGHQASNAKFLTEAGATVTVGESRLHDLDHVVSELLSDEARLEAMAEKGSRIARPDAAREIAMRLIGAAR